MKQYTLIVVEENDPSYRGRWAMQNASFYLQGEGDKYRVMKSKNDDILRVGSLVAFPLDKLVRF